MAARSRTRPPSAEINDLKKKIRKPGEAAHPKVLVFGRNGTGKTRFAATAPKVLIVDLNEEGDRSIKGRTNARVLPVRRWEDIANVYWYLKGGKHPFQSVALDTVTGLHELAMEFVLEEAEERDPTRERAMPTKKDWNRSGQLTKSIMSAFRNLPMIVIFTAQERVIRDEDTNEILEIVPSLPAGARGTATDIVGIVGRMRPKQVKEGKKRKWVDYLITGKSEQMLANKDRTNQLPEQWQKPDMPTIIEAW